MIEREVFGIAVKTLFGAEIADINFGHFLHILRSAGGYKNMIFTRGKRIYYYNKCMTGGAQQDKIVEGAQVIYWANIFKQIGISKENGTSIGGIHNVEFSSCWNRRIRGVRQRNSAKRSTNISQTLHLFSSRYLGDVPILTREKCPLSQIFGLFRHFQVITAGVIWLMIAGERLEMVRKFQMGRVIKFVLQYSNSFWREMGLSGESMSDSVISFSFEYSENCLVCYALGTAATKMSKLRPTEVSIFDAKYWHCSGDRWW